jgi:hypothetical protein
MGVNEPLASRWFTELADEVLVPMNRDERAHLASLLDEPSDDFKRLAELLSRDGCKFPKQQAALMLFNTPGVAAKLLDD